MKRAIGVCLLALMVVMAVCCDSDHGGVVRDPWADELADEFDDEGKDG